MKDFLFTDLISFVGEAPKKFDGYKKYVSTGAVNGNIIESDDIELVDYSSRPSRANLVACSGDILFAKMAETEKTLLLDDETEKNIYSTGFCAIRAKENIIEPKALYYLLGSSLFLNQKNTNSSGATQRAITNTGLSKIRIKLPTMEKQRVFCGIMDKVVDSIELRKKQLGYFDKFTKSLFIEMFGDISDQDKVEVSRICKLITDGTHQPPKFEERGIPFLFVSNIVTNNITYDTEKFISEETYKELIKRTPIEIGDLLLSTVGSYGHAAIVKFTKRFCFQRHIAYLKPKSKIVDSEYFRSAILSDNVQRQIHLGVKGIAQKTLNLSEIRKLRIPLPPMVQQQQFAKVVIEIDKSKLAVKKSLEELEVLKKSLMQKYFA